MKKDIRKEIKQKIFVRCVLRCPIYPASSTSATVENPIIPSIDCPSSESCGHYRMPKTDRTLPHKVHALPLPGTPYLNASK
jgi:hypothetical protein